MACRLKEHSPKAGARAVILAPTRELALQTHKVVAELGRYTSLRTAILVGGDSMEAQFAELTTNPDIIVATPGESPPLPGHMVQSALPGSVIRHVSSTCNRILRCLECHLAEHCMTHTISLLMNVEWPQAQAAIALLCKLLSLRWTNGLLGLSIWGLARAGWPARCCHGRCWSSPSAI